MGPGLQVAPTADTEPVSEGDREMRRLVAELHAEQLARGRKQGSG
jgi:hypothetical protein